ncbi:MAG: flippase [Ruminococcaceae bacterium]|nr:flippase [Oscillospiraceae bacterium]
MIIRIKKLFANRIVKNASWIIGEKVIQMLISFVVGILTARYLGPSNYGLINYASSYAAFFMAFCTLGINSILVKEFIDSPDEVGVTIGTTLVLRSVSSFLSAITIIVIVCFVDAGEPTTIWVVALSSLGLIFQVFTTFNYWFQAQLKSKITAIASFVAYIVTAAYKIYLLYSNKSVLWFAFSLSVDYIVVALFLFIAYKKNNGKPLRFSWKSGKRLLSKSYHFILPSLMVAIYGNTDRFMLKHMMDTAEVGIYAIATAICSMWCFVLSAIIDSFYPSIMEANNNNEELFKKKNKQLYAIVFYVSMFVSLMFQIFAPLVIKILYGVEFIEAIDPLRIVTWYTAFSYLGVARNAWIVCKDKQKYLILIYTFAAVSNIGLNMIFIPLFGASGAAVASLIAQIFVAIVLPLFIKPLRENSVMMLEAILLKGIK